MGAQWSKYLDPQSSSPSSPTPTLEVAQDTVTFVDYSGQQLEISFEEVIPSERGSTYIQSENIEPEEADEKIILEDQVAKKIQLERLKNQYLDALDEAPDDHQNLSTQAGLHESNSQHLVIANQDVLTQENEANQKEAEYNEPLTVFEYNISEAKLKAHVHSNIKKMQPGLHRKSSRAYPKPPNYNLDKRKLDLLKFGNESLDLMSQVINKSDPGYEEISHSKHSPHQLRILYKNYVNAHGITVHSFIFEYYVNCTPHQFGQFCENFDEQNRLNPSEEFRIVEDLKIENDPIHNVVFYLAYPKIFVAKARDFLYLKTVEFGEDYYQDIARSITHAAVPEKSTNIRGEIFLIGTQAVKAPNSSTGTPRSKVTCVSELNVKAPIPGFIARQITKMQVKSLVERTVKRIDEIYS